MIAEIVKGERDTADVLFLIAAILFVIYAMVGWAPRTDARLPALLLGIGWACVAVALLVL